MSDPPPTQGDDSVTITMPIDRKLLDEQEHISPAHAFDGLLWRLHVKRVPGARARTWDIQADVHCEGDNSCELWRTNAKIQTSFELKKGTTSTTFPQVSHTFCGWKLSRNMCELELIPTTQKAPTTSVSVRIESKSQSFARRIPEHNSLTPDVTLVLKGQKFAVAKQELSAQSSYFDTLFYSSNFKESRQDEIEIKGTDPKDFDEVLKMVRGFSTEPTTASNAILYLTMADMFDLQIVKDHIEQVLLTDGLTSIHRKYLIAEQFRLQVLKKDALHRYKRPKNLWSLRNSPRFVEFPDSLVKNVFFRNACDQLRPGASCHREERTSEPPAKKSKNSIWITILLDPSLGEGVAQASPVNHFNGLAWRLRVVNRSFPYNGYVVSLHCDSDGRSELWQAKTDIRLHVTIGGKTSELDPTSHRFVSWRDFPRDLTRRSIDLSATEVSVEILMENDGESFARRPTIDFESLNNDVILVVGGRKFPMNKQALLNQLCSAQSTQSIESSYLDNLFHGDFKDPNQKEIEIRNTDPEDFHELLKMLYGVSTEPTTVDSAIRYLTMADKFGFQIVRDRLENFLLSTDLISIHRKFLLADYHKLEMLKSEVHDMYKRSSNLCALVKSKEFDEFSDSLVKNLLFGNAIDLLQADHHWI